jgi:sulfate transport system ATP-binding protein
MIDVRDVNKSFGPTPVLRDITVDIASGSLTALLGPSGGGKSTLLRIIAGLEQPDTGTVVINGTDATRLSPQRRNVGFVFQHYAAFKHLSVYRNIAFGLEVRKRPKAEIRRRVHELLELVHLEQMANRYPSQLSGGQRQRMALARALAVEPQVLLLDEPFGALDAQVRKELRTWLRRLHDEVHVTTVFVTHDQEEAMDVSDEIVLLADGIVQQVGPPHEIYDNPANPFVMSFLGPVTQLDSHLVRPHDIDVSRTASEGSTAATVTRVVSLGFEIRIEATSGDTAVWAQLTRADAKALDIKPGDTVYLRPAAGASPQPLRNP